MHEKSCFKIFTAVFSALKDKQYTFKINITNSIDFMIIDLIEKFIKTSVNISLNNNLTMMTFDSIIYKFLKFK